MVFYKSFLKSALIVKLWKGTSINVFLILKLFHREKLFKCNIIKNLNSIKLRYTYLIFQSILYIYK